MSRLPFELLLAFRYLRPKRTFVSVITLLSVIGVTLGVAVLIIVISVMSGFDRQLRERILGFNAHLKVFTPDGILTNYPATLARLTNNPHVRGAAPFVLGQVLIESQPASGNALVGAPWVRGVDAAREPSVSVLPKSMVSGEFNLRGNGLVVGREFAHQLELSVGDRVAIYSPRNIQKMRKAKGRVDAEEITSDEFVVRGIFDVGHFEYNANIVCVSLANAQDLYDMKGGVHGLMVMLDDPFKVDAVRRELRAALGPEFMMRTWTEENSGILNALLTEKNVMFYILFFIMVVAAFGITSVQITFVVQKTREIGVMKALGATRAQVMRLFLSQSIVVGVFGVLTGFGLGMLAVHYRNEFLDLMNRVTGFELFPASIYLFDRLPAVIIPGDIAIICGGSLVICVVAGLIPAWNAGRLQPVEALRHE
ncbi:MAG: ABC transporter permease [Verrucomicrobia bacterium]|nr:ABC transporter permease [Verrucomicrobiota bacterium]